MVMLDANMILCYLLNDNVDMAEEAERIIREDSVWVTIEIIAEVVYVLKGVYHIERDKIAELLLGFVKKSLQEVTIIDYSRGA